VIRVFDDLESLSRAAADEVARLVKGGGALALSGGSTPRRTYELLADRTIDWSSVEVFWGDERPVPPDHADSNYRMATESLLSKVRGVRLHRLEAEKPDAAERYEKELARVDALVLAILGMGPDGHTASLFPGTAALRETKRRVVPNPGPGGAMRVTMTAPFLNRSRHKLFIVAGEDKASTLAEVLEGPRDPERLPAQLIERADWYVDRAAASKLKRTT
jgi:6-phosphogluconolactonase